MKVITWEWRGQIMTDYFIFWWLQFSKHFEGQKHWSWEFHWKGSKAWYCNFRRHTAMGESRGFKSTRLTVRFGKRLMVVGNVDMERYYKDVTVTKVVHRGKVTFLLIPKTFTKKTIDDLGEAMETMKKNSEEAVEKMKKGYDHLCHEYPDNTWRN